MSHYWNVLCLLYVTSCEIRILHTTSGCTFGVYSRV